MTRFYDRGFPAFAGVLAIITMMAVWPVQAETKEHSAHVHGESAMNIVLDGKLLEIEFISPAENILGFEHAPETDAQKKAVESARETLSSPVDLLGLPVAAQCVEIESEVEAEFGDDHSGHGEFHSLYRLECSNPNNLVELNLKVFDLFPNTDTIEIQLVTGKAQTGIELDKDNPVLNMGDLLP